MANRTGKTIGGYTQGAIFIFISIIIAICCTVVLSYTNTSRVFSNNTFTERSKANHIVNAAIEYAKFRKSRGLSVQIQNKPLGDGVFSITANDQDGSLTVVGIVGDYQATKRIVLP